VSASSQPFEFQSTLKADNHAHECHVLSPTLLTKTPNGTHLETVVVGQYLDNTCPMCYLVGLGVMAYGLGETPDQAPGNDNMKSRVGICYGVVAAVFFCYADGSSAWPQEVWQPAFAESNAPIESARVRIVDFGADFLRGGDGQPRHLSTVIAAC
jgi:hypothetical protein